MNARFDKLSIAVCILSLATDPARAATTVGDFSEESATHGLTWFWRQILRTLGGHIFDNFTHSPGQTLMGALAGLMYGVLALIFAVGSSWFSFLLWFRIYYTFVPIPGGTIPQPPGDAFIVAPIVFIAHIAVGLRIVGASRHPLSAWVLWATCCTLLWAAFSISRHHVSYYPVASMALVLAGVITGRRRLLRINGSAVSDVPK